MDDNERWHFLGPVPVELMHVRHQMIEAGWPPDKIMEALQPKIDELRKEYEARGEETWW